MSAPSILIHDYVHGGFEDVIEVLRSKPSILTTAGADSATGERAREAFPRDGAHRGHRHMAIVEVHLRDLDGRLRLFALVGGAQEPVTEILLEGTAHTPDALDTARRFLDTLARLLQEELAVLRVA